MAESDDSVPHPDPRLPPELERTIFEIVALSRPSGIPNLMLVAARVKAWIEPLLYRIVLCRTSRLRQIKFVGFPASTITVETLLRLAATTGSPSVIQNSIRHLFLDGFLDGFPVSDRVDAILTACSGVTNLFAHFHAAPHLGALGALHCLHRITIDATALMEPSAVTVPHPMFRTVTHLDLTTFEPVPVHALCARLSCMPRLTHLALNSSSHIADLNSELRADARLDARLECIVRLYSGAIDQIRATPTPLSDDARFVCIEQTTYFRLDWLRGADSGEDYWALADRFIAARRAGKCDRSHYMISDTDDW
ncbi:hypothetical protein B0H13DRAFT_2674010 [Mycena leptocephala]|nr:hypothetical protein B0H13DRAFT_2674010 [Mycena leptocephala]